MSTIQVHSRVGDDGVLEVRIPLGAADANTDVVVTVAPVKSAECQSTKEPWADFISNTYGSCAGLGFEEPADLPLPND
ncbi:MAG: hypothetical protein HZA51_16155 [Planctomycetes bacterium]|nr:hypothetical protein [Planctomycetota bacterium]